MDNRYEAFTKLISCAGEGRVQNWLLVMPKITRFNDQQYNFPVGLPYVSAALKASGRNVFTLNLNYKEEDAYALIHQKIDEHNINIVASGGISTQCSVVKEIFDSAKAVNNEIITVAGGGLITSDPVPAMTALGTADIGIIGEGEITSCELAYALETGAGFSAVSGLIYASGDGGWAITPQRAEIDDLDIIPWPDYDGFEYTQMLTKTPLDILTAKEAGTRTGIVYYSRSCPYNCTFCFHSSGKKYRTRSLDSFFTEFDYVMQKYSLDGFYLADEFFIRNTQFVRAFCKRIRPYQVRWSCSGRVDNITREILELLKEAGCYRIGFGVESANDHILKSMRKNITRAQIENAFRLCQASGMEAQGNLIFGDLEETADTAMDTIDWWRAHQDWALTMHWIIAYPGSHVYNVSCERGIIPDPVEFIRNGCPEVNFSKMTVDERRKIASTIDMLVNEEHDVLLGASLKQGQSGKVTLKGCCPYCHDACTYPDLDPIRPIKLEICPSCRRTLRLYAYDYMDEGVFVGNIEALLKSHKVAFWPVVSGVSKMVSLIPDSTSSDRVFILDSSPFKQGAELSGKVVQSPDAILGNQIDTVIITTTTSVGSEIMHKIQSDYPSVKYIELIGNLFFESSPISVG